ncbi:LIM and calponin homology domains-containing protein 1-like isoform X2 [Cheilinus undulatus]|uniref:LIM and calponin homology domains-containing protein 1-like isoform X2 n=1 Tax=Cheilinus undulatus TaxID=241271 RepID=UPI001BD3FB48|nr:LIM and calponin homology domains-containing protein 1-like isoform X2 [Cheilinus undulatus]
MASPVAGRDVPNAPTRDESERLEPNHPEPACQEAQKWIEAVTGKSFGEKDFRSGLENGILLCELLSAIKPGLVKKINRLPTPIAGLDNLSVFLRGCEELGLRGSQLFDPGDLQDTSIRANLRDSDCNRKLKNVLNTVFWLGKAASGCASYSGPTLNLKEFEGLLAQMKVESEDGDSPQKRSVRDSGYDCWDSERSESLSPPRHTRDNSLDSLDSFGSRSQHSPSPDVVNRGNSDGRGSDSEADAPSRRPDVRKDDMLARRTASSEARSSIPFNQFLPNRANACSYIPTPRRKQHTEEGEQRSHNHATPEQSKRTGAHHKTPKTVTWAPENNEEKQEEEKVTQEVLEQRRLQKLQKAGIKVLPASVRYSSPPSIEEQEVRSPSPNIILRCENDFLSAQKPAWDSFSDGEEEAQVRKIPDVHKDDLATRRANRGTVAPKVHQFVPPPVCSSKDRERWEGIRRASQQTLQEKEISEKEAVPDIITRRDNPFLNPAPYRKEEEDEEEEEEEGKVNVMPNKQKDDLAQRRAQSRPLPHKDGPLSFVSTSMSQSDMQKWERLKITEPSEASPAPVCQACLEKNYGSPFSGSAKAARGHSKVVTFGGVTEIEQPIETATSSEGEETELLRRLLSKATVAMPSIGLGSRLSEREGSQVEGTDAHQSLSSVDLQPYACETLHTPAELDARLAQYEQRTEEDDDEEEEERIPDLQKDDMMARRTGVFHKQSAATVTYNRFLPLPASQRCKQGEAVTDAAPRSKKEVLAARSKILNVRVEQQQPRVPMETPKPQPDTTVIRATSLREREYDNDDDEYDENEPVPDLEKDDMMARRTSLTQKPTTARTNQFLPVPGSVKYNVAPVSAMKPFPQNKPKLTEKTARESIVTLAAEPQTPSSKAQILPKRAGLREKQLEEERKQEGANFKTSVTEDSESLCAPLRPLPPSPAAAAPQACKAEAEMEQKRVEERVEEKMEKKESNLNEEWRKKPFWLDDDDDLPPMMMSRRVAFMSEDTESVSMGDILNEEEGGHLPPLSQSRYERMHEQYNNFVEEEDHWRDDLARWKNRRRSASQELIKKEEERKRLEKRLKDERSESNKRKSIKTYKEIVEEKERREAELCEAYRNAATPEEAAMVLERYALRFTISDATLDSLKLPRSTSKPKQDPGHKTLPVTETEASEPALMTDQSYTKSDKMKLDLTAQQDTSDSLSSTTPTPSSPLTPLTNSELVPPKSLQLHEPQTATTESPNTHQKQAAAEDAKLQTIHTPPQNTQVQPAHTLPSPSSVSPRPVPLIAAKPYCQPRSTQAGHKPVKLDGLVRMNGEVTEDISATTPSTPSAPTPQEMEVDPQKQTEREISSEQTATGQEAVEQTPPLQTQTPPKQTQTPQTPPKQPPPPQKTPSQTQTPQTQTPQTPPKQPPPPQTQPLQTTPPQIQTPQAPPKEPSQTQPLQTTPPQKQTPQAPPKEPPQTQPMQTPPQETPPKQTPPPKAEKTTSSSASAISSLIGGRNCIITTTIVTELTQTVVEPLHPDTQSNGQVNGAAVFSARSEEETKAQPATSPNSIQDYSPTVTEGLEESSVSIETPMLNLAKRVNHWVWDPNEERKRLERWQQEQERLLQEQYEKEQEKLKKEWEKAQIEVEEEERKHNEEERKILEETVTPLNPTGLLNQQADQTGPTLPSHENEKKESKAPYQLNGQRIPTANEDQHASKLHFFQESPCDEEPSKKQELCKTASLDRNPQLNQPQIVKRSESQDAVTNKQQPSPSTRQPPSPSRCVSGKRLCSGCSQPLGKGAAMIIDTLGLFFHIQCFKCGVCKGQLGDATAGTDVRIRNGLLSCHECYIASRGRGQPTTL